MRNSDPIHILLVAEFPQVRGDLGLALRLAGTAAGLPVVIVGEADGGPEAVQMARLLQPQVILLDLHPAHYDGCPSVPALREASPSSRILALTVHSRSAWKSEAATLGLDGFAVKGAPLAELLQLIAQVMGRSRTVNSD